MAIIQNCNNTRIGKSEEVGFQRIRLFSSMPALLILHLSVSKIKKNVDRSHVQITFELYAHFL